MEGVLLYDSAVSGNCYEVRLLLAHQELLGELNPGLRVPTLVLDDGRPLGESDAIAPTVVALDATAPAGRSYAEAQNSARIAL
jgi:glutathione S-transferase